MRSNRAIKLAALLLCGIMFISLFSCVNGEDVTGEITTEAETETPTERPTSEETSSEETSSEETTSEETASEETSSEETTEEITSEAETAPVQCDGTHEAKYDAKKHWRDACEEHGISAVVPKSHQLNFDSGAYMCKICGYVPECRGIHTKPVYLDEQRHYVGPCEYCTFEGDTSEYAKHNFEGKDYICADCGYDPECNGLHGTDNGDGTHTSAACELCGARASNGAVPHENSQCDDTVCDVCGADDAPRGAHICQENDVYLYQCTVCGTVPSCNGIHEYEQNEKGHTAIVCDECGYSGSGIQPHSITERTEQAMDSMITKYACTVCGYVSSSKEIPAAVNKYIAAVILADSKGYNTNVSIATDESGSYYHAEKSVGIQSTVGQHIWLREKYNGGGGGSKFDENIDIGTARYLVIKTRKSDLTEGVWLMLSTTGWNMEEAAAEDPNATGRGSVTSFISFKPAEKDTWATFVVDLTVLGKKFAEDKDGGYVIDTFSLMQDKSFMAAGDYIDIGYVAFVDDIEEAKLICDTPTLISIDANKKETVLEVDITEEETTEEATEETTEKTSEEETETEIEEETGYYSNGNGIGMAGAALDEDAFALRVHKVDESAAKTITASELLALLENKNGLKRGEVYKVTEPLMLASDKTYYGNLAAIIADGGIVIKDISGTALRDIIVKGSITVENSAEISLYKVDIKGGSIGISVDEKSSEITVSSCIVTATDKAIDSNGAFVSVYQSKLAADTGIASTGTDLTVQSSIINAGTCGITSSGRYFIAKNNTVKVKDVDNGVGIEMTKGSYNSMAALNVINNVQKSISVTEGYNCVVELNRAITITASDNTHFYLIKNRLGGEIKLKNNDYIIADRNTFIEDEKAHPTTLEGNTNVNGDNMHDVNARLEYGADEELLPHTDPDQYFGMERRTNITDLSSFATQSFSSYIKDEATWNKIVIVPPGAYYTSSVTLIGALQSNTDFYLYGSYIEATYANDTTWEVDGAKDLTVSGLTLGNTRSTCGQIHILAVDKANNKLTATVSAGFVDGFVKLPPSDENQVGYNDEFLYKYHQNEDGGQILTHAVYGGSGNISSIVDNKDGTYTVNMTSTNYIEVGDVFTTRLDLRGQNAVYTHDADGVYYKDLTTFAISNTIACRVRRSYGVVYERYHSTRPNGYEITEETYNAYKALGEKYGVDLGVYYDEEYGVWRGPAPIIGASASMEVEDSYEGTKLICSKVESTCDDGSNQRGNSSRIAGMVNNGDGTYTVYFKGNQDTVHRDGFLGDPSRKEQSLPSVPEIEKGNIIVAYTSDGHVLIDDAIALTDQVQGSPKDLHIAHTGSGQYCDECGKVKYDSNDQYREMNTEYDHTTGLLTFDIPVNKGSSKTVKWRTRVYSVVIDAKYVNEELIDDFDFCFNGIDLEQRVIIDNMSKNCSGILFDNVLAENIRSRALLAKAQDVTVKNCTFRNLYTQALILGAEAEWSEGTIARDVLIENCIFDNCAATTEYTKQNGVYDDADPGTVPIDIRGVGIDSESEISNVEPHAEMLASNFVIRHNKFINTPNKHMICVTGACDVTITENVFEEREGDGEIVYINGCYNVKVDGNTYSERIQALFDSGKHTAIADIYNCEKIVIEDLKIPEKVTLKPSN